MAVKTDYSGRDVDLLIMQGTHPSARVPITLGFGGDAGGYVTTGVQKAAQLFMLLLFTEQGTKQGSPLFGTRFISNLRNSNLTSEQVSLQFRDAAATIMEQQQQYLAEDAAADEKIANLELTDIAVIDRTQLTMTVTLTTVTGETRDIFLPVTLAIR